MNAKHREILKYLHSVESGTIAEIYKNVSFSYYCNASKHLGAILSTMVKNGQLERIKKGQFKVNVRPLNNVKTNFIHNQINIF